MTVLAYFDGFIVLTVPRFQRFHVISDSAFAMNSALPEYLT